MTLRLSFKASTIKATRPLPAASVVADTYLGQAGAEPAGQLAASMWRSCFPDESSTMAFLVSMEGPDASGSRNRKALHWVKSSVASMCTSDQALGKKINSHLARATSTRVAQEGRAV